MVAGAPPSLIDLLYAPARPAARSQILIDPDADRARRARSRWRWPRPAARRGSAMSGATMRVRLRQLSDEIGRIAATLARLSSTPDEPRRRCCGSSSRRWRRPAAQRRGGARGHPRPAPARALLRRGIVRRSGVGHAARPAPGRDRPAPRAGVSSLCIAAAVPATTALRWIKSMTDSRPVRPPRRPARRPPGVRRAGPRRERGDAALFRRSWARSSAIVTQPDGGEPMVGADGLEPPTSSV